MPLPRDATVTQPVLIPGQQLSVNVPWERDDQPPPRQRRPAAPPRGNVLDARGALEADVVSGVHLGACQVIRRLTPGSAHHLLALRDTWGEGLVPVVMRKLEVSELYADEIAACAEAAGALEHPHLARVFPCEVTDEGLFWVTALVPGATLAEISDACVKAGKSVPVGLALAAVHEAALALAELHAPPGEAHALLGDQSLVVGFDGEARLLDVGLFNALKRQSLWPEVLDRIGPYLAPEQVERGHLPDPRSDVFSLAALLHAFLSGGRTPAPLSFDQRAEAHRRGGYPPPSSLNIALSAKVDAVVMKALSANPLQRHATAVELAHALKGAAAELFWRPALRAQFVGQLFAERKRREEVLFAATAAEPKEVPMRRSPPPRTRTPPWAVNAALVERPAPLPAREVITSRVARPKYALGATLPHVPAGAQGAESSAELRPLDDDFPFEEVPFCESADVQPVAAEQLALEQEEAPADEAPWYEEEEEEEALRRRRSLWLTLLAVSLTWFWQQGVMLDEVPARAQGHLARLGLGTAAAVAPSARPEPAPAVRLEPAPAATAPPEDPPPLREVTEALAWAPAELVPLALPLPPWAPVVAEPPPPARVVKLKKKSRPVERAAKARRVRR